MIDPKTIDPDRRVYWVNGPNVKFGPSSKAVALQVLVFLNEKDAWEEAYKYFSGADTSY